ncbi:MAG TPA: class I SAM-dependent methyltransferase, partial [Fimbriimonadaceae bacterium]|nr:class I SAM-dependent methyltransferase [Fimbriimonadaceae bacterium]
ADTVAQVCGVSPEEVAGYIQELESDRALRTHISTATQASERRVSSDLDARYGRRAGWYAVVRAMKPRTVVETGVDKGLGSVVLAAALMKNAAEGRPGKHYGTDIDPAAGFLLSGPYAEYGEVLYGDSIKSLSAFEEKIDVFVNDSDHSAEYEAREYEVVAPKLSDRAVILGDNAHVTDCLFNFAHTTGRQFLYFGEIPEDHWYPGSGIGFAFRKRG